jgi:hypothetical protein
MHVKTGKFAGKVLANFDSALNSQTDDREPTIGTSNSSETTD